MSVTAADLLLIPPGGVTRAGLELNIRVATLFIHSWLAEGRGCFALDGRAEDSATAEISRSQVVSIIQGWCGILISDKYTYLASF